MAIDASNTLSDSLNDPPACAKRAVDPASYQTFNIYIPANATDNVR
jgi:hypothetical protein